MTNPEKIYAFLRSETPKAYCDDCVAKLADIYPRQQINPVCAALGLTSDFDRREAVCEDCRALKLVTKSLRYDARV
ncbi:hypothetical protein IVB41_21885 [Bradyrhizobium sp. 44]|uniref:hypothetical protein n=1 Tax=Bradyrhizobium sp. 44 TaxID=2782675 RepID=UPI001FF765B1|nr:hypothetical protein [Bradyrhizobium sp. 44]MCK1286575.1 hypothetical protein [Bradyrhizobium sp. 44]